MERATVEDLDASGVGADSRVYRLADALGAERVAVNRYRIAPGDGFPGGLHAHADQEEAFVVLAGAAVFETCASPVEADGPTERGETTVAAGEAVRFAPGEFQSGRNAGGGDLVALAIGAPRESDDVRVPFACPDCRESALALDRAGEVGFVCPACGAERAPDDCPACGRDDLRATLDDEREVVAECADCGAAYDRPPVRGAW